MSSRATKVPDVEHVLHLVRETAHEMGIAETDLPHILFFYVNPHDAAVGYAALHAVRVQGVATASGKVYEVWINSELLDPATVLGAAGVLSVYSRQNLPQSRLREIRDRVCARVDQVVSVNALRSKQ